MVCFLHVDGSHLYKHSSVNALCIIILIVLLHNSDLVVATISQQRDIQSKIFCSWFVSLLDTCNWISRYSPKLSSFSHRLKFFNQNTEIYNYASLYKPTYIV